MSAFSAEDRILVTGASSGIGRAIALLLNGRGATVIASGRDESRLAALREAADDPARMLSEPLDLAEHPDALPRWLKGLRERHGRLRGLALAAGITWNAPMSQYDHGKAREIFDICCHAPLILAGAFCDRRIRAGKGAAVVCIAAGAAANPNPGQGMYAAAKAGLIAGARCLAAESAPSGVRVNCVSPGLVETPMLEDTVRRLGPEFLERERRSYPLGLGLPEDVAHLAAFLLSDEARWITGLDIPVTGGRR